MSGESWEDARYLSYIEDEFEGLAFDITAIRKQFRSKLVFSRVAPALKKMVGFFEFIDSYVASPQRRAECGRLALVFGDIVDFKSINSRAGMAVGDHIIRKVGDKLNDLTRRFSDAYRIHGCYHISGDEFLMVVSADKVNDIGNMLTTELDSDSDNMTYAYYEGQHQRVEAFKLGFGAALLSENFAKQRHDVESDAKRRELAEMEIKEARSRAELACFVAKITSQGGPRADGPPSLVGFCRYEDVPEVYLEARITERPKCNKCLTQYSFDVRRDLHAKIKEKPFACPVCAALDSDVNEG